MADVIIRPDAVAVSFDSNIQIHVDAPIFGEPELFNSIYPHRMTVVTLDPYRTCLGWPMEAPKIDVHTPTVASCTGIVLAQRPSPQEITTGAMTRWIAGEDTYDEVQWRPSDGDTRSYKWETTVDFAPTLSKDISYFVGKELFIRDALNFDANTKDHMWSNFRGGYEGNLGYSVLMAVILHSAFGDTEGRQYTGLWSPGGDTPAGDEFVETDTGFSARIENGQLILDSESSANTVGLDLAPAQSVSRPVYLGMTFGYPVASSYISFGPGNTTTLSSMTQEIPLPQSMKIELGRSTGDVLHTADMAILDLNLYSEPLSQQRMLEEIAILSQSYGG